MINVITSGFFNPFGLQHRFYLEASYDQGRQLAWPWEKVQLHIIVNNDKQVKLKGSCPFQSQYERYKIIKQLYPKAKVVISKSEDESVAGDIVDISHYYYFNQYFWQPRKTIFCNGGDRTIYTANLAEISACNSFDTEMRFGVGGTNKIGSSSSTIERAAKWYITNKLKESEN